MKKRTTTTPALTGSTVLTGVLMPGSAGLQVDGVLVRADVSGSLAAREQYSRPSGFSFQEVGLEIWPDCRD